MKKEYKYPLIIQWTGNTGSGTKHYTAYERSYSTSAEEKPVILGSSDPAFRGDKSRWNPEELLVSAVSSCHMLWYLHLCADAQIVVEAYEDSPIGKMIVDSDTGVGSFAEVILQPVIKIFDSNQTVKALELHQIAHEKCFIANSVNFAIHINPTIK